jgi:hypothetical protein
MIEVHNEWNGKYYSYPYDLINNDPKWNRYVHNNNYTPNMSNPLKCGYCNTSFLTRYDLFYHLGFMNIDIRCNHEKEKHIEVDDYDIDGNLIPIFNKNNLVDDLILDMNCLGLKRMRDTDSNSAEINNINFKKLCI